MTGHQAWLAEAPRAWGLTVVEVDGWQTRGSTSFDPHGGVAHHTAGPSGGGDMPSLGTLVNGRPDLAGPLCNYGLGRSGTVYVVAAGRANHAGSGGWHGLEGNSSVLGIEAENDGYQPWPQDQLDAYTLLCAAACEWLGFSSELWCRHHEWRAEKPDPHSIDGDAARAAIAEALAGGPHGKDDDMAKATFTILRGTPTVYVAGLGLDPRPVTLFQDAEYHAGREGITLVDAPPDARQQIADGAGQVRWVMVVDDGSLFGLKAPTGMGRWWSRIAGTRAKETHP